VAPDCALLTPFTKTTRNSDSFTVSECRDPKDDKFLEVAVAGKADVIVSGDEDLEVLDPFEGIPVISPAKFLRLLASDLPDRR
jgi:uncharacterized protein